MINSFRISPHGIAWSTPIRTGSRSALSRTTPVGNVIKPFHERDLLVAIEIAAHRHALERRVRESELRYATRELAEQSRRLAREFEDQSATLRRTACRFDSPTRRAGYTVRSSRSGGSSGKRT